MAEQSLAGSSSSNVQHACSLVLNAVTLAVNITSAVYIDTVASEVRHDGPEFEIYVGTSCMVALSIFNSIAQILVTLLRIPASQAQVTMTWIGISLAPFVWACVKFTQRTQLEASPPHLYTAFMLSMFTTVAMMSLLGLGLCCMCCVAVAVVVTRPEAESTAKRPMGV